MMAIHDEDIRLIFKRQSIEGDSLFFITTSKTKNQENITKYFVIISGKLDRR